MNTHDMNHSHLPSGIRNDRITALDDEHQEAALDEALCESFPASDPIAVSFTSPPSPPREKADAQNSKFRVENKEHQMQDKPVQSIEDENPTEEEQRQMAELAITFDGRQVLPISRLSL